MPTPQYLELPQNLNPLDEEQILMLASVDEDESMSLVKSLIETFIKDNENRFDSITEACQQKNIDMLRQHTHFICGSTGNLGMTRVATLCRQAEKAMMDGNFDAFDTFSQQLKSEYLLGMASLKTRVGLN